MSLFRHLTLRDLYRTEVETELAKYPVFPQRSITEADIARLPGPVQRYFRASGFVGRPHTVNARIVWQEMHLKRSHEAEWLKLACEQINFVPAPARIALMTGKLGGFVPFEGRDKYQEGHGNMQIRLLKVLPVGNVRSRAMDESALVTVLSEALFVPSCALQSYITWQPVDGRCARAELTYDGIHVHGVFTFNDADELVRFATTSRWQDGERPRKVPWSANVDSYEVEEGVRRPRALSATWHEESGDFTYVRGTIASVRFNVGPAETHGLHAPSAAAQPLRERDVAAGDRARNAA